MVYESRPIYRLVRKKLGSYNRQEPGAPMHANFILGACVGREILELTKV